MDDTPKVIVRKHKSRAPEFEWRQLPNGGYNHKPNDPEYLKKYMAVRVECPLCGKMVPHGDLSKHKKRRPCLRNRLSAEATNSS